MQGTKTIARPDAARVAGILVRYRPAVLEAMRQALDRGLEQTRLMRVHLGWEDASGNVVLDAPAGKMLRPALCLLCCEAVGGDAENASSAAASLELVHNFSLIHDDIEDNSRTRHGRPTLWSLTGVSQAINAGDGLFAIARRTLLGANSSGIPAERVLQAAAMLDDACIALCEGQHADIGFEMRDDVSLAEYERMIGGKTAALLSASGAIGAVLGGASAAASAAIAECGRLLGMAFQIQDDVLGIWGQSDLTGKSAADDIRSRKKSFPVVYAFNQLEEPELSRLRQIYASRSVGDDDVAAVLQLLERINARRVATDEAARWARLALDAIAGVELDDERRRDLEALASFFVYRES